MTNERIKRKYVVLVCVLMMSLVLSLVGAEISLRVFRNFSLNQNESRQQTLEPKWGSGRRGKEVVNILALGDSYTFGGFGKYKATYPNELSKLFLQDKSSPDTNIMNQGICESTSKQILAPLKSVLMFSHADMVLLLVGSADLFDPYPFADELMTAQEKLDSSIKKLLIFKAARFLYNKLVSQIYHWRVDGRPKRSITDLNLRDDLDLFALTEKELQVKFELMLKNRKPNSSFGDELRLAKTAYLLNRHDLFFEIVEPLMVSLDSRDSSLSSGEFRDRLSPFFKRCVEHSFANGQTSFDQRYDSYLNTLKIGLTPNTKWVLWRLVRAVSFNLIESQKVVDAIEYSLTKYPYLRFDKRLSSALVALRNINLWRDLVGKEYEKNIRNIVQILKEENVLPILQTYPISYQPINSIIRKLSRELSLPLVDHEEIFRPLIAKDREKYILNDTHCTDEGHQLMAANVFKVLRDDIFSNEELLSGLIRHGEQPTYTQLPISLEKNEENTTNR